MSFLRKSFAVGLITAAWCLSALSASMSMAPYAESYNGPKTLTVELARTVQGDQALIKVRGINHPWDGKVVLTTVRKDSYGRIDYVARVKGQDFVVLQDSRDKGTRLSLPGEQELPLGFDREASMSLVPAHLLTDYERPEGAVKP